MHLSLDVARQLYISTSLFYGSIELVHNAIPNRNNRIEIHHNRILPVQPLVPLLSHPLAGFDNPEFPTEHEKVPSFNPSHLNNRNAHKKRFDFATILLNKV